MPKNTTRGATGRNVYFQDDVWERLAVEAKKQGISSSAIIGALVKAYLSADLDHQERQILAPLTATLASASAGSFLQVVRDSIPAGYDEVELTPDAIGKYSLWIRERNHKRDGILGLFIDRLIGEAVVDHALQLMRRYELADIWVVLPNGTAVEAMASSDLLEKIGIRIDDLGGFAEQAKQTKESP